jgi:hypothetical protein
MPPVVAAAAAKAAGFVATFAANTLGVSAATALTVAKVTYYATTAIIYASVAAGSAAYARKMAKKAMRNTLDQGRTVMVRQPAAPREIVYGTVRKSGVLVFAHTTGTNNEFLHLIVALAGHEVNAIGDIYLNDEVVSLDGSGNATSAPYVGFVRVQKFLGTPTQAAAADLVTEAPTVWTTDHRLREIAYVYVRLKFNQDAFPGGIPNISAIVQGKKVLDTRTSTTGFSSNWALCLRDYMADAKLGLGVAAGEFDTTALNAAANIADQSIGLNPSGTEARYTANGVISTDAQPGDVISQMASAGAGFVGYIGGEWIIHAGAYRTPTVTLDENDLRGPISVQTKVSRREIFNGVKGVFTSPTNQWQPADFPPITNATYTTEDGGVRIWQDIELPFTTSPATAQRLAKIALERVRQQIVVRLPCKLTALRVQAGDNVMLTNDRLGWSSKVFEVQSFSFVPDQQPNGAVGLGVDLILRETASAVWDWNNGEETIVDPAPNTDLPNPFAVAAPTSLVLASGSANAFLQEDGTLVPRIKATWVAPADEFVQSGGLVRIEYKPSASSDFLPWNVVRGDVTEEYITDVETGVAYDVRIRGENGVRVTSSFLTVTGHTVTTGAAAPSVPSSLAATGTLESITLAWAANTESDLAGYQIFRNTSDSIPGSPLRTQLGTSFVDTDVAASTTYYYWVKAVNRSGVASAETSSVNAIRQEQSGATGFLLDASGSGSGVANNTVYTAISGSLTGLGDLRRHELAFLVNVPFSSPEDLQSGQITIKRGVNIVGSASIPLIVAPGSAMVTLTVNDTIPSGSQSYTVEIDATSTGLSADYDWSGYLKIY